MGHSGFFSSLGLKTVAILCVGCASFMGFVRSSETQTKNRGWVWGSSERGSSSVVGNPSQLETSGGLEQSRGRAFGREEAPEAQDRYGYHGSPQFINSHQHFDYQQHSQGNYHQYPPYDQDHESEAYDGCICYNNADASCLFPLTNEGDCAPHEIYCCKEARYASLSANSHKTHSFQPSILPSYSAAGPVASPLRQLISKQPALPVGAGVGVGGLGLQDAYQTQTYGQNYNQYINSGVGSVLPEIHVPVQDPNTIEVPFPQPAVNPGAIGPGGFYPPGPQYYIPHQGNYADFSKWFSSFVTGLFVGTQGANLVHYLAEKKEHLGPGGYPGGPGGYPYVDNEGGGGGFIKLPFLGSSFWKLWGFSKGGPFSGKHKKNKYLSHLVNRKGVPAEKSSSGVVPDGGETASSKLSVEQRDLNVEYPSLNEEHNSLNGTAEPSEISPTELSTKDAGL